MDGTRSRVRHRISGSASLYLRIDFTIWMPGNERSNGKVERFHAKTETILEVRNLNGYMEAGHFHAFLGKALDACWHFITICSDWCSQAVNVVHEMAPLKTVSRNLSIVNTHEIEGVTFGEYSPDYTKISISWIILPDVESADRQN